MKKIDFCDVMGDINEDYIRAAHDSEEKKKSNRVNWGAMAACVCLLVAGVLGAMRNDLFDSPNEVPPVGTVMEEAGAFGFMLSENEQAIYFPISFDERRLYGLVDAEAVGLTEENDYKITETDLGEFMGIVGACNDEVLVGSSVYHFANYPEFDSICIVETPDGFAFYTGEWRSVGVSIGERSDVLLENYGLPESLKKLEVLSQDFTYLFTVEDEAIRSDILKLLGGRENSGAEANERRFAEAWYDTFGNADVYYDEADGRVRFKQEASDEQGISLYDQAHDLWSTGERLIRITTNRGFRFEIDYFPSINTFLWNNGYFEIPDEEKGTLNALLQIE